MGKTIKRLLVIAIIILIAGQSPVSALSIADNRELYTDNLAKEDIVAIHDMDYLYLSLRYQSKDGGILNCQPDGSECTFEEGKLQNHSDRLLGKARVFELKNGQRILDVRANSELSGLGSIRIQQKYTDSLIHSEEEAKIVSSGFDFAYGNNLVTNYSEQRQRGHFSWFKETATISSLRLNLSTPQRTLGLAHWRDVGNVHISIMTYKRFKITD